MSIEKEASGRRSVRVEVEVKGTPEQVWQAIATGPGISSWFVPANVDGRVGGTVSCDFGGGMVSSAAITTWQPPHRFVVDDSTWLQGGPPVATEWTVEARAGGTCIVRVVHSLFASTNDWDDQLEGTENGWPGFFRVLRYALAHHRGQPAATMQAMAVGSGSIDGVWNTLVGALGVRSPTAGQQVRVSFETAAPLVGTVERVDRLPQGHCLELRLAEPLPGIALASAVSCMGMLMATLQIYVYGEGATAVAARDAEAWRTWLAARFPASNPPPAS